MSKILIIAFILEGIGLILLAGAILLLVKGKGPGFIEAFVIGQIFFNIGIMFHLGYLTALVKKK